MLFNRYIACGDSFTEGMADEVVRGHFRGWADRVADVMAEQVEGFTYANLAIRGKLVHQVIENQIPIAISFVTGPETLISFHAGANDVLRPNYKPELVLPAYKKAVRTIAESGATVMLFTVLERTDGSGKSAEIWAQRFSQFNENVRSIGKEVGAIIADANEEGFLSDRRFLAEDRLHLNPIGHDRVAQAVLEKLELPFSAEWRIPLPPRAPTPWHTRVYQNFRWFVTFLAPWMWRRLRGKSSGDGRSAKQSAPIHWPIGNE
ncbi:MAG: SGNH/GDSL hydrolase family protein [Actinobacteria bacterium]|uniref:Unannotated protein n=1 Tax=freshwater metagenome TaxID=449393 RepID=A0A6J7TSC8_9ZZZZ|nr:SGNH/GDSL hydrolase family protein [Actinomycetota bacterium]MSW47202.1 SGNH/GDSL hydrolase family protein [Actinomycetota bacterium]MSX24253.1 SGNH/GDSL hydrolase family protein [Actinomycetota bacterium]MSY46872.1 SGNH/GDSL hydrolase family protein [Actinomycetota bacterium]MSY56688.1 SGNH/GDSL hydrolase family protein [Actinomycetota bacterium]